MRQPSFEGKWTPNEILGHLADSEWVFGYRLRAILTEDRPALTWFDQDSWVARANHNDDDPTDLRELFRTLRVFNLLLWRGLSPVPVPEEIHHGGTRTDTDGHGGRHGGRHGGAIPFGGGSQTRVAVRPG